MPNQPSDSSADLTPPTGAESSSQLLSASQIAGLKAEAEQYRSAQRQVTDAFGVLWNAQLDIAIKTEDPDKIQNALMLGRAQAFYDNCNCNLA
jgi:hypothetical protein